MSIRQSANCFYSKKFQLRAAKVYFAISSLFVYFNSNYVAVIVVPKIAFKIIRLLCGEKYCLSQTCEVIIAANRNSPNVDRQLRSKT